VRSTGGLAAVYAGRLHRLDGGPDFWRYGFDLQRFLRITEGPRVIIAHLHGEAVTGRRDEVPFTELPTLGGPTYLRGYAPHPVIPERFNDAWLDFKFNPNVSLQAGLMLIPFTRNILQSSGTYWAIDVGAVSATYIAATQTSTLRDTGVQIKINAADNHFELRGMASQGIKLGDAEPITPPATRVPGKNDPRLTAYAQYNIFDGDTGYVFNGQYFGRKKIAGVALGTDYQSIKGSDPYFATSATAFAAIPVHGADPKNGGDEFGGQIEYLHFHGGGAPPASGLGKRNDMLIEAGYYNRDAKLSVFGKFEGVWIDGSHVGNTQLYGGGLKYFLAEAIANVTLQYSMTQYPHALPMTRNTANLIQLQLQLAYF
jgi:hypothetical protein